MRKLLFCFLFFLSLVKIIAAQPEKFGEFLKCKESRITEGSCSDIIESLRGNQETDSIAIEIFKKEYKIDNMRYRQQEWLFKKKYVEIIQYFSQEENKKFYCQLRNFKYNSSVLLID